MAARNVSALFDTTEVASHDLSMFPKWRRVLQAFEEEESTNCHSDQCDNNEWQAIVESLRGKDLMTQLRETNIRMNENRYVNDSANWALLDYWATPFEFLRKEGGDCEDYAIAKYMMLRHLGVPTEHMRIVVVKDLKLRVGHAVLAVYIDGTPFILDNRYSNIVPATSRHDYEPVYSINEHGWWLHRPELDSSTLARVSDEFLITKKMPAAAPIGAGVGGMFAAQLASLPTNVDAMRATTEIQARYFAILKDSDLTTRMVDLGAKGIWYRVLAGPFGSRNTARTLCAQLRAASPPANCIVITMQGG